MYSFTSSVFCDGVVRLRHSGKLERRRKKVLFIGSYTLYDAFTDCDVCCAPQPEGFGRVTVTALKKDFWLHLALEKLYIHPNHHTCPLPVSFYYTAMILLWRLPLEWNTICFLLSPISFSHHSRQAFTKPKPLRKPRFCHSFDFYVSAWHISKYFKWLRF